RRRARGYRRGGEVVPVGPLARDRGEQPARPCPPGVDHDLAADHGIGVAVAELPAGYPCDLRQRQGDHRFTAQGSSAGARAARAAAVTWRSSNGSTAPPTYWPVSWPLPATTITSPGAASATACPMAAARSGSMITRARSATGTPSTPSSIAARM